MFTLFYINWSNSLQIKSHNHASRGLFDSALILLISQIKLSKTPISQNSDHCNFFPMSFKNMFVKKNCLYTGREKEYSKYT